ncbi:MAG: hypothetical protein HOM40_08545 [Flavobacteriales bacterium]|nr:hypothetical protein [Flavobacteriales bacterium]
MFRYQVIRSVSASVSGMLALLLIAGGCKKGEPLPNQRPDTHISIQAINLTGSDRLNSLVELKWWGSDADGYVKAYEFSFDQVDWILSENQDSTFLFSIDAGSDTIDIDFWVRAIDDKDERDESPAYLRIPLKNTPPLIEFDLDLIPSDTSHNLLTLTWDASDLDGDQTIEEIQLKINNSEWTSISPAINLVSIVPDNPKATGLVSSTLYLDSKTTASSIDGLIMNDTNSIYLRAIDIAGSVSTEDTVSSVYVKSQTEDLLVIGANTGSPNSFYQNNLSGLGISHDFIDFVANDAANQPRIWSPTFGLLLAQYEEVLMITNDVNFTNVQTNAEEIILEFAASSIQAYVDNGGKIMLTSSFPNGFSTGSALFGVLPVDSFSTSVGQARLPIDSLAEGIENGYPDLTCGAFISGLDPFYPSSDATPLYTAQLTKNNGWEGPNIIGAKRSNGGQTNMVLLSVELHKLDADPTAVQVLLDKIFNDEFAW